MSSNDQDKKTPASGPMLSRFQGARGRKLLLEVLSEETVIRGADGFETYVDSCELLEVNADAEIITQGGSDNDLYLIVSGSFNIHVNGRHQATRRIGQHVGEIALIDSTARRTTTVIAAEHSVVLKCPEIGFTKFANANPKIWRRLAVELSRRLSERNKSIRAPRTEPVIFIGCSTEALSIAEEVQSLFSHEAFVTEIWVDGIFNASSTPIEDLTALVSKIDFAIIVITPDDKIESRNKETFGPRDNLIFELGLAIGAIGRARTVMLVPRGAEIKIPTDLLGVRPIDYPTGEIANITSRLRPACVEIKKLINRLGPI